MKRGETVRRIIRRWGAVQLLIRVAVRLLVPRHRVGVAAVVVNGRGELLLVEHVVRNRFSWGLPGGWVDRGESPADAVRRELREELGMDVAVGRVLVCERSRPSGATLSPDSIAIAFDCKLTNEDNEQPHITSDELLNVRWTPLEAVPDELLEFNRLAIAAVRKTRGLDDSKTGQHAPISSTDTHQ